MQVVAVQGEKFRGIDKADAGIFTQAVHEDLDIFHKHRFRSDVRRVGIEQDYGIAVGAFRGFRKGLDAFGDLALALWIGRVVHRFPVRVETAVSY